MQVQSTLFSARSCDASRRAVLIKASRRLDSRLDPPRRVHHTLSCMMPANKRLSTLSSALLNAADTPFMSPTRIPDSKRSASCRRPLQTLRRGLSNRRCVRVSSSQRASTMSTRLTKVWVVLTLPCRQSLLVVVPQELVQEVYCLIGDVPLVICEVRATSVLNIRKDGRIGQAITHHSPVVINRDHGLRGYRPRISSNCESRSISYRSKLKRWLSLTDLTELFSDRAGNNSTHYAKSSSVPSTFVILTNWSALSCPWKNGSFRKICPVR
jgi:hypothetical protein